MNDILARFIGITDACDTILAPASLERKGIDNLDYCICSSSEIPAERLEELTQMFIEKGVSMPDLIKQLEPVVRKYEDGSVSFEDNKLKWCGCGLTRRRLYRAIAETL